MKDGSAYWVEFRDDKIVFADGRTCEEKDVVHLPPCSPTKILCVHVNYISRYYEFNTTRVPPKTPTYFQKPLTALNAHKGELVKPQGYTYVNYEGEMAVVFGKVASQRIAKLSYLNRREILMFASLALVVLAVGIDPKPFTDAIDPTVGRLIEDASHSKLPTGDGPAQPQPSYMASTRS